MTLFFFFFSSRRRHTRCSRDWSSDVCSSDLKEACRGIADACRALDTPVTGGNVSFYNESPGGAVDPTPVVGMIGLLTRADRARSEEHTSELQSRLHLVCRLLLEKKKE